MQQVLSGLNSLERPDFVTVYLDDVLIFSDTLNDHLSHLRQVIGRIMEAGLKLKPAKCCFVKQEVSYLGHIITPRGILPNPKLVEAVRDFPVPTRAGGCPVPASGRWKTPPSILCKLNSVQG